MDFRPQLHPEYALAVIMAVLVALAFPITRDLPDARTRRQYWKLQALVVIAAVIGAKLAVLFGEFGWPFKPVRGDWAAVLVSGRVRVAVRAAVSTSLATVSRCRESFAR